MRKFAVVVLLAAMALSFCSYTMAEEKAKAQTVTGSVDSINPIDPERNDFDGGIIVRGKVGDIVSAVIDTNTIILGKDGKTMASGDIRDGDMVKVEYTVGDAGTTAVSVREM